MIDHYNAFISYKHAPEDNVVAEAVHKGLERFHIPGKLRKKTGFKRINRIFRDKDELPITNDLSDTIAHALENSDYLIVICSTNTKKSAWVPREIEYFLKNHTKRQIFTVLVNGEPYEVIPEILLYEDRVVTDEEGNERTERVPMEPLSCDFRDSLKRAKKTELPRLAAGLIGCSYDELMNRHRQYRMKQLTAGFSLALLVMASFSGYMYYSKNEIHKTYLESLRNQSKYLANESEKLLEKEQRITALELALYALPKDETDDRPVTAEAVRALTDATLAYEGSDGTNLNAAWNYQMPNSIVDFTASNDTIAILDMGDIVGVWNTDSHERILYLDTPNSNVEGIRYIADSSLLVLYDSKAECYDTTNGNKLWEYVLDNKFFRNADNILIKDDTIYLSTIDDHFLEIQKNSGKLISDIELPKNGDDSYVSSGIVESKLSPDGNKIAFRMLANWNEYTYGVYDIAAKTMNTAEVRKETIKDIRWVNNDCFMLSGSFVDSSSSMSFGNMDLVSPDQTNIYCINAADLSEKWKADFVCNGVMVTSGFLKLDENSVAYHSGNLVTVYDIATGKEIYRSNLNSSVVDVSDNDGDGTPIYITKDGGYAIPAPSIDTDAVYYVRRFADELSKALVHDGIYVLQDGASEVIFYGIHVYDDSWETLSDNVVITDTLYQSIIKDDSLFILSKENESIQVIGIKLGAEKNSYMTKLDEEDSYNLKLLGINNERLYLAHRGDDSTDLISVDIEGKDVKTEELFKYIGLIDDSVSMKGSKILYHHVEDTPILTILDVESGEKKDYELSGDMTIINNEPRYFTEEGAVYLTGDGDRILDTSDGTVYAVAAPEGFGAVTRYSDNCLNGVFAVSDGQSINLIDKKGNVKTTIKCPGTEPLGMIFDNNELYVLYTDGALCRYSSEGGELVKKIDASVYPNSTEEALFEFDHEKSLLFVRTKEIMSVIDLDNGIELAHIYPCLGYNKKTDSFITMDEESNEGKRVGCYKRYTVDELIEKAKGILKGAELSNDLKSRYGIE